jgi:predicted Zn-dependent protease
MQHVLNRHATRRMISQSSTLILFSILAGREAGSLGWGGVRALSLLKFSRDDEAEADRKGLGMLLAAKVDPVGMVRFFSVLEEQSDTPALLTYFSTHPRTEDRISELKTLASQGKGPYIPLFPGVAWQKVCKNCGD